jgi:hypothetical protein
MGLCRSRITLERLLVDHVKQGSTLFIRSRCWVAHVATYGNGSVGVFHCLSRLWSSLICYIAYIIVNMGSYRTCGLQFNEAPSHFL